MTTRVWAPWMGWSYTYAIKGCDDMTEPESAEVEATEAEAVEESTEEDAVEASFE